jgi:hypothetical protein
MSLLGNEKGNRVNSTLGAGPDARPDAVIDSELQQALRNFQQSVHAWSDAAYVHPRTVAPIAAHRSWRLATGWALGCALAVGSLAGVSYEQHHRQVLAHMKAAQEAKQRELAVQLRARSADEDLLATVDSDVSRVVPAAMEPLAQLMDDDGEQ